MKNNIWTLVLPVVLTCSSAQAVTTVGVSNLQTGDTSDRAIIDNGNNFIALGAGSLAVGYFDTFTVGADFTGANRNELLTDFQQFSTTTQSFQNASNAVGFFDVEFSDTVGAGSPFIGETLYTVIGNAATLGASTEFLVFEHTGKEFEEEQGGIGALGGVVRPDGGALMLGSDAGTMVHPLSPGVGTYQFAVVPVPEPSSTALLGLGAFAFVLRRRR